jgi:hypothetical protein
MRQQTIIRKTDLMVTLYRWIQSSKYQKAAREVFNSQFKDYEDYVKKCGSYSSSEAPIHTTLFWVLSPLDMVGTLLYRSRLTFASLMTSGCQNGQNDV